MKQFFKGAWYILSPVIIGAIIILTAYVLLEKL